MQDAGNVSMIQVALTYIERHGRIKFESLRIFLMASSNSTNLIHASGPEITPPFSAAFDSRQGSTEFNPLEPIVLSTSTAQHPAASVADAGEGRKGLTRRETIGLGIGLGITLLGGAALALKALPQEQHESSLDPVELATKRLWELTERVAKTSNKALGGLMEQPFELSEYSTTMLQTRVGLQGELKGDGAWSVGFSVLCTKKYEGPLFSIGLAAWNPGEQYVDKMPSHYIKVLIGGDNMAVEQLLREGKLTPAKVLELLGGDSKEGGLSALLVESSEYSLPKKSIFDPFYYQGSGIELDERGLKITHSGSANGSYREARPGMGDFPQACDIAYADMVGQSDAFSRLTGIQ